VPALALPESSIHKEAAALVERARQGDQNAMSILVEVRKRASAGNARARRGFAVLRAYIDQNPPGASPAKDTRLLSRIRQSLFGAEFPDVCIELVPKLAPENVDAGAVVLSHGAALGAPQVRFLARKLKTPAEQKCFIVCIRASMQPKKLAKLRSELPPEAHGIILLGQCVGIARAIQAVRLPGSQISGFSSMAGWELGE
jgi:hypothetical protein